MNPAAALTISTTTLNTIKTLARRAKKDRGSQTELYYAITKLSPEEKRELMALFTLGRPGIRSYNVARKTAANANLDDLAGYLSDTRMLYESLREGIRRHKNHS